MASVFFFFFTHTVFCDGQNVVKTMCRTAYEKGLAAIGFSSHAPIEKAGLKTFWNMKAERMDDYVHEVRAAQKRWEGKLAVYMGLEIDYIKGRRSALDDDISALNLDYSISSVHFLFPLHGDPFTIDGSAEEVEKGIMEGFNGDGEAMMNAYWDAVLEMIVRGGFDIEGHLDLVKKQNAANRWFNREGDAYQRRCAEIAQAISAAGLLVEINTGGINRGHFKETCPSLPILRLLRRHDVSVVITADAHNAKDLDGHYQTACETLLEAGYASHFIFEGKNDGKASWREISL
jgi:histidinol-phosphatase (PHP family)